MKFVILLASLLSTGVFWAFAQNSVLADFTSPSDSYSVCLQEPLQIQNNSQNAIGYLWDFCPETFTETPIITESTPVPGLLNGWGYKIVRNGDEWTGFLLSRNTNKLFRLEFGTDPSDKPQVFDLGNPGNLLVSPQGLEIVNQDGNWYGFVGKGETTTGQVVRLDFGSDLHSTPNAVGLGTFGVAGRLRDVRIIKQDVNWVLIVALDTQNALLRINLRESLNNVISSENISSTGALTNASLLVGFSVTKYKGDWVVHTVSYSNHGIQQYTFGNNIFASPTFQGHFTFSSITRPYYIKIAQEADGFYGFVANESKNLSIIKFAEFASAPEELPNSSVPKFIGFDILKSNSRNIIQGSITGTTSFGNVIFENTSCGAGITWSTEEEPSAVSFSRSGNYKVELVANGVYESDITSNSFSVTSFTAPLVEIRTENKCLESAIKFSVSSNTTLNDWTWDFGDNMVSSGSSVDHVYQAAGDYEIKLLIKDINGCRNRSEQIVSVYPMPAPDFPLPTTLLCTNNSIIFPTTTPDIYDGNLSYQWFVDDNPVSTERDLEYTFTTTGSKEIKLKTSIPGCSDEIIKTTSSVQPGPVVDFSFTGICEDEMFSFRNETSDAVESLAWDFGNGQTSIEINPTTLFTESGDFAVSLTATNTIGCENVRRKTLSVRSVPVVDFTVNGPPNACSGINTVLHNATVNPDGAAITEWLWDHGDGSAPVSQMTPDAEHVFVNGGSYTVSLTAITEHGCVGTVDKTVVIEQAPSTTFSHTPACDDQPVSFTGPSGEDISGLYWEIGTSYYDGPQQTHTFRAPGDYRVYLEVSGWNECVATQESIIHVPAPLAPDFSVLRNCVNQEAILTDITTGVDPVVSREWELNNGDVLTSSPLLHTFTTPGNQNVTLQVTAVSGCVYAITKQVEVLEQPVAAFSADPDNGAYPLTVSFTNTSSNATQYLWDFADGTGSSSSLTSPVYTFSSAGTFPVMLMAFNDQQCESYAIMNMLIISPLPDADIALLTLSPNPDGSLKLIATIHNKGNTIIRDLPMNIDLSGKLSLRTMVDGPILPGAKYNAVLGTDILNPDDLRYVCASIDLENDLDPALNKVCQELGERLFIFPAYPNPAGADLNVEWICQKQQMLTVTLTDAMGRSVFSADISGDEGLNRRVLDVSNVKKGVYILSIGEGAHTDRQRILILGRP